MHTFRSARIKSGVFCCLILLVDCNAPNSGYPNPYGISSTTTTVTATPTPTSTTLPAASAVIVLSPSGTSANPADEGCNQFIITASEAGYSGNFTISKGAGTNYSLRRRPRMPGFG